MSRSRPAPHRHAPSLSHGGPDPALLALEAFDRGCAVVDLVHRTLQWCSPGFEGHCCVPAGSPLAALEPRLPGVEAAMDGLLHGRGADGRPGAKLLQWRPSPDGPAAQATLGAHSLAVVRLLSDHDDTEARERAARRHLEDRERLLFTSRALSVGEMASTLAHELNQPIGTVANVLRGIRTRLERQAPDPAVDALLQGVQLALEQSLFAARIIARIRDYTHSRQPRHERLDLAAVLRESLALLDWELQRDEVCTQLLLPDTPCPVLGDEVMLQQLVVNLLRNALEAMRDNPPGDSGRVERRLVLRLAVERNGREAVMTLRDNGCGLPQDAQQRMFVPFQSTKPNGMGIGLNICRSFVELHQGRLWFSANDDEGRAHDGAPPRGCTFHVALPLAADAPPQPTPSHLLADTR